RQGSVVRATVGGQFLRDVTDVHVSGAGVRTKVIQHCPPLRNLEEAQRAELARRMRELIAQRWAELAEQGRVGAEPPWGRLALAGVRAGRRADAAPATQPVALPAHPLLYKLEEKSLRELLHVVSELREFRKRQPNTQIAEAVLLEITLDPNAAPGDRELRLQTRSGLTNPLKFQVGHWPEAREVESNDPGGGWDFLPEEPPLALPAVVNGQVMPGDVDRIRFQARQGQKLVVEVWARRLVPYLADAVPGWFQATVALYDAQGKEIAFADDYRFEPDPVLCYEIPADGAYDLEIRDAIYRGREDFVYRIALGERPFITHMYPLGCHTGAGRYAVVGGWNLWSERLFLEAKSVGAGLHETELKTNRRLSNRVTYAVDALPDSLEAESNDTPAEAQSVTLPRIVNGRVERPGDMDLFSFEGRAGQELVVEVVARRLRSPLDAVVRVLDAAGHVLAWNDDAQHKEGDLYPAGGLLTHEADSYLRAQLPADGVYYVQVADAQSQGGAAYGYRLRISLPQPDFELRMTPASVNVRAGLATPIWVYALRKDGFDGAIEITVEDDLSGFRLDGARIPAGRDRVRMTLTAPPERPPEEPVALKLAGHARVGRKTVSRPVVPAEDMMQAFLYRHLVPAQELMVAVLGRGGPRRIALTEQDPVRIPAGGTTEVHVRLPGGARALSFNLELSEPPPGVTLEKVTQAADGPVLLLRADEKLAKPGYADNLIVEVFTEAGRRQRGQAAPGQPAARMSVGCLPAIPIEIVSAEES
ncbi:MAG: PPC domain-containing protein, partial [Planctomycetota bacterium]